MYGLFNGIITIMVDEKPWIDRAKSAALLVIHTLSCPVQPSEPLKRDDLLFLKKIDGGGTTIRTKTCLVLDIKTHSLRVLLPEEKQTYWNTDIKEALASTKIKIDTLELFIGKLNHAVHFMPPAQYFLNRLRHLLKRGKKWGLQQI